MTLADQLYIAAQEIADKTPRFDERLGPGMAAGNGVTNAFLSVLNAVARDLWPKTSLRAGANAVGVSLGRGHLRVSGCSCSYECFR